MGAVKFGNCGVGEVMIIKNGVVKNLNIKYKNRERSGGTYV